MATDAALADELVGTIRKWIADVVIPKASDYEHADEYPEPWVEQMKAFGLFGARIDPAYGGLGLDTLTYARLMEELAYGWMSLAGVLNTHTIAANLVSRFGTDDQKQRWLPAMATGEKRAAFSLSEPDAGSDTQAIRCKAVPDGGEYLVNGTKMWVTNGERAQLVALAARTPEGITCFIVEKEPGSSFGGIATSRRIDKLGYKGLETVESRRSWAAPTGSATGSTTSSGRSSSAASTSRRVRWASRGRRTTRPCATPTSGRRSASRSTPTRPSSSSSPTWPRSSRHRSSW
jgi:butyryl-CoA dehydrogenase